MPPTRHRGFACHARIILGFDGFTQKQGRASRARGAATPKSLESVRDSIIDLARTFLGRPYVWGGETPLAGFDCSGLVKWVLAQHGIEFPKWARAQYDAARRIEPSERKKGDLVFFVNTYPVQCAPPYISHVGILVDQTHMINANSQRGIAIDDLTERYWYDHLHSFGRVL